MPLLRSDRSSEQCGLQSTKVTASQPSFPPDSPFLKLNLPIGNLPVFETRCSQHPSRRYARRCQVFDPRRTAYEIVDHVTTNHRESHRRICQPAAKSLEIRILRIPNNGHRLATKGVGYGASGGLASPDYLRHDVGPSRTEVIMPFDLRSRVPEPFSAPSMRILGGHTYAA